MIEVNLLPPEFRKKKIEIFAGISISPPRVILGILIFLFCIQLFLSGGFRIQKARLARLDKQWKTLEPYKGELDALSSDLDKIDKKVKVIDSLILKRFLWAKKLNQISNLVTRGIWLRELRLAIAGKENQRTLMLKGTAFSRNGDEPAIIAKFMKQLKENQSFYTDFQDMELGTLMKRNIKNTGVMDFTLICYFKPHTVD